MSDYWPVYSMFADEGYKDQTGQPFVSERTAVHIHFKQQGNMWKNTEPLQNQNSLHYFPSTVYI